MGWDPGAVDIARMLSRQLGAPLRATYVSRLVIECNRSLGHPRLWSEFTRDLGESDKRALVERVWLRHRDRVRALIESTPSHVTVVHVGVHTFTPSLDGRPRTTDLGLLYDPRRATERAFAERWLRSMKAGKGDGLRVHRNRPYRGDSDGLVTALRSEFDPRRYLGFELEISQRLATRGRARDTSIRVSAGLREAMGKAEGNRRAGGSGTLLLTA
jgi:predicted N-formylglutamate amidohydrolase